MTVREVLSKLTVPVSAKVTLVGDAVVSAALGGVLLAFPDVALRVLHADPATLGIEAAPHLGLNALVRVIGATFFPSAISSLIALRAGPARIRDAVLVGSLFAAAVAAVMTVYAPLLPGALRPGLAAALFWVIAIARAWFYVTLRRLPA